MTIEVPVALSFSGDLPPHWQTQTMSQLQAHENVWAALEVDLDTRLHFVKGLVLATNQRY
jgi:ATP-binding cassette subfamily B protein